ncbi:MAG: PAS domain S-box protein [Desulfotomaculaceae bacterium]|nr:PAS domain S-box protein [Desulfotomaculaceae bacterium]
MRDEEKPKEQLFNELVKMRQQFTEMETRLKQTEALFYDCQGKIEYLDSFMTGDSEYRLAEDKLRAAHQQLLDIIEFLPDATFVIDKDKKVIAWNRAIEEMTGMRKRDIIGKGEYAYGVAFHGKPIPLLIDFIDSGKQVTEGPFYSIERKGDTLYAQLFFQAVFKGKGAYLNLKASPLYDSCGNLTGAIESIRDITNLKHIEDELRKHRDYLEKLVDERTIYLIKANQQLQLEIAERKRAEEALRSAQQQLTDIIDFLPEPTFVIDRDKKVIAWNRAIAEMTGVPKEAVLGKGEYAYAVPFYGSPQPILIDLIFSDDLQNKKKYVYVDRKDNKIFAEKYYRFPFSGIESNMWGVAAPLYDKHGSLAGAIESIRDITKHKRTEATLETERQRLYYVLDRLPAFVCLIAADYSITFANLNFRERFGDPTGKYCFEVYRKQKKPCANCPTTNVLATNTPVEWAWTGLDGRVYQIYDYPFDDIDGSKLILELMIEITESKQIKEALEISEAHYRAIVEDQTEFICRHMPGGTITFVNEAYCRYLGIKREILLGNKFMSFIGANALKQFDKHFSSINTQNPVATIEINILMPWGENRWQHWTNRGIFNEPGQLVEFQSVGHDITKRKLAEQALQESETKYRTLVERIPAITYIARLDETSTTMYVSPQIETILGFTQADYEAEPDTWQKRLHPDDRARVLAELALFYESNEPFQSEYRIFARNGSILWFKDEATITRDQDGHPLYVHGVMFDITQHKQVEEALRTSEERFYKAFNASPVLMAIISLPSKNFIDVNESWLNIMGYKREEVLNRTIYDRNIQENIILYEKISKARDQWPINNMEIEFCTKNGEKKAGLFSGDLISLGDESCFLSIIQDITEKVQFGKEMARLDRLNLVGEMAAGIGHEIRNPMTSVRGFLQIFCGRKEFAPYKEHLDLMIEELDRANSIITEFLSLAKNKVVLQKAQNLNHIVQALSPLIKADGMVADKHIEFELNDIPKIALDDKEIRQLILNLVRNGFEAMSPGGKMKIKTFRDESFVVLAVRDPGKGIKPDVLEKLGTPFFTTKDNGTGLGLAMCYSIAARHNAKIQVETGPEGTTFLVKFKCDI